MRRTQTFLLTSRLEFELVHPAVASQRGWLHVNYHCKPHDGGCAPLSLLVNHQKKTRRCGQKQRNNERCYLLPISKSTPLSSHPEASQGHAEYSTGPQQPGFGLSRGSERLFLGAVPGNGDTGQQFSPEKLLLVET